MSQELWTSVDHYLAANLVQSDAVLDEALQANARAGLPTIDVTPNQGKLLYLLARIQGARRILEIGTLGGYSTIWLGRALPSNGRLVTLEVNPKHAEVALANINRAQLTSIVDLRVGPALQLLSELHAEGVDAFDLIFIDADKPNNPAYLEWALRLSRPGTVIIGDNVVRSGAVIDSNSSDAGVQGTRSFIEKLGSDRRLEATAIQTVGGKGYDGFAIALVTNGA
jgi:predicted O-methyltransferase YrrM